MRRAALLRWRTPLVTALSRARAAVSKLLVAASASRVESADRTWRTRWRRRVLTARLRSRRFSLCRWRFSAEGWFATGRATYHDPSDASNSRRAPLCGLPEPVQLVGTQRGELRAPRARLGLHVTDASDEAVVGGTECDLRGDVVVPPEADERQENVTELVLD